MFRRRRRLRFEVSQSQLRDCVPDLCPKFLRRRLQNSSPLNIPYLVAGRDVETSAEHAAKRHDKTRRKQDCNSHITILLNLLNLLTRLLLSVSRFARATISTFGVSDRTIATSDASATYFWMCNHVSIFRIVRRNSW